MAKYLYISSGLRGCYADGEGYVARVSSRRELRALIAEECEQSRIAYGFGGSQAEISSVVAQVWREATGRAPKPYLPYAIGFGCSKQRTDRPFGVFISHATRDAWRDSIDNDTSW
jgi:hypothetical protein